MSVRRAMVQMLASRQFGLLVRAVGMVVLARLLTPDDFGVFAIALAIAAVATTIADFGLSSYLIKEKVEDRRAIQSAVGLSLTLVLLIVASSAVALVLMPAAWWAPGLRAALMLLAFSLLLQPVTLAVESTLQRDLRFGLLAVLGMLRVVVQTVVAIALALIDLGPVALAGGVLAEAVVGAVVLVAIAGRGRLVRPSVRGWGPLVHFGLRFTATGLVARLGHGMVVLAISRLLGLGLLGQFNRAQTVVRLFDRSLLEGVGPVILPAISRSLRDGEDPARVYLAKVSYLAALCWPVFAVIALLAEPLVHVLLGDQWDETVPAVRILALMGLFLPFTKMSMKLFVALERNEEYLRLQIIHQCIRVLLVTGGALISLEMACLGVALAFGAKTMLVTPALKSATGYRRRDLAVVAARCAGITATSVAGPALVVLFLSAALPSFVILALAGTLAAIGWLIGVIMTRHPLLAEFRRVIAHVARRVGFGIGREPAA